MKRKEKKRGEKEKLEKENIKFYDTERSKKKQEET